MILRILAIVVALICAIPAQAFDWPDTFHKADVLHSAFNKTGAGTVSIKAGTTVNACSFAAATAVAMPTLNAGTDYEIRMEADCDLYATPYTNPPLAGSVTVGGFHYLPGGYPNDYNLGGNTTPTILEWSFWDVKFRPAAPDPRGMTKIGNAPVWIDIYFEGDSSNADGISRNNDTALTGTNPPVRAIDYGGNGIAKYGNMNWWTTNEFLNQWGKRLPRYSEMTLAAFGAKEGRGRGNHPIKTGLNTYNASTSWWDYYFTSKFGLIQSVGAIWIWTSDLSDWQGTASTGPLGWTAYDVAEGRGKPIMQNTDDLTALLFGGKWSYETENGSRQTETIEKLWDNSANIAIRGASDHYWAY